MASITGIGLTGEGGAAAATGAGFGNSYECPTVDNDNVFPFNVSWTKSMGKHSLKWGGEFVRYRNDRFQVQGSGGFGGRGTFVFDPTVTELYTPGVGGSPLGPYGSEANGIRRFYVRTSRRNGPRPNSLISHHETEPRGWLHSRFP
jgi:hypothetical protein